MPKISVHIEADSAEEFADLMAAFSVKHVHHQAAVNEVLADAIDKIREEVDSIETEMDMVPDQPEEKAEQPVEEKKTRKRGPNKPKMTPVTEDAPEQEEKAASAGNGEVMTKLDAQDAGGEYFARFGTNFGAQDVSKLLQETFGPDVRKISAIPEDAESYHKAVTALRKMLQDNPHNRKVVANG